MYISRNVVICLLSLLLFSCSKQDTNEEVRSVAMQSDRSLATKATFTDVKNGRNDAFPLPQTFLDRPFITGNSHLTPDQIAGCILIKRKIGRRDSQGRVIHDIMEYEQVSRPMTKSRPKVELVVGGRIYTEKVEGKTAVGAKLPFLSATVQASDFFEARLYDYMSASVGYRGTEADYDSALIQNWIDGMGSEDLDRYVVVDHVMYTAYEIERAKKSDIRGEGTFVVTANASYLLDQTLFHKDVLISIKTIPLASIISELKIRGTRRDGR